MTEEICSNTKTDNTIISIFAREAFDRSKRVAVDPTRTTDILSGEILAGKTAVPAGLDGAVITALYVDGTEQVLEVQVAPVIDFESSRILELVRELISSLSSSGGVSCGPHETHPAFGSIPPRLFELCDIRDLVDNILSIGANPELYDSADRQPRDIAYGDFTVTSKKDGAARHPEGDHLATGGQCASVKGVRFRRCSCDCMDSWTEECQCTILRLLCPPVHVSLDA